MKPVVGPVVSANASGRAKAQIDVSCLLQVAYLICAAASDDVLGVDSPELSWQYLLGSGETFSLFASFMEKHDAELSRSAQPQWHATLEKARALFPTLAQAKSVEECRKNLRAEVSVQADREKVRNFFEDGERKKKLIQSAEVRDPKVHFYVPFACFLYLLFV